MKKGYKRNIQIISIILIFFLIIGTYLVKSANKPPFDEIEFARKSIFEAKKANANTYTNELMLEAESLYESALNDIRKQSEIIFVKRNYKQTLKFAIKSSEKALEAKKISVLKSKNLKLYVQIKIDSVESYNDEYKKLFLRLPVEKEWFEHYSIGNMLLSESKYAFKNKNYIVSEKKIDKAYNHLDIAFTSAKKRLDIYFENYNNWISWVDEAIDKSKKEKKKAIIIDKFSKKMYLYKNGSLTSAYDIELGKNWIGEKKYSGDKTTPEGKYKIVKKKQESQTKYFKALLIDYPNTADIKKFNHAKKEGSIPKSAKIGSLIEIHGNGGKGTNWTDGCVALFDDDMNLVYASADEGTPVIIVGSLLHLSEIYN